jgi:hypothetical protein
MTQKVVCDICGREIPNPTQELVVKTEACGGPVRLTMQVQAERARNCYVGIDCCMHCALGIARGPLTPHGEEHRQAARILRDVLARGPAVRTPCPFCRNVFHHSEDCPGEKIADLLEPL